MAVFPSSSFAVTENLAVRGNDDFKFSNNSGSSEYHMTSLLFTSLFIGASERPFVPIVKELPLPKRERDVKIDVPRLLS